MGGACEACTVKRADEHFEEAKKAIVADFALAKGSRGEISVTGNGKVSLNESVLVDFRCPMCDSPVIGSEDVGWRSRTPTAAKTCQNCGSGVRLVHDAKPADAAEPSYYWKEADPSSTVLSRFEVSDPLCGTVDNYPDRGRALDRARSHQAAHAIENDPDPVTVFDRMAHLGDTCLWGSDGRGMEKRTQ